MQQEIKSALIGLSLDEIAILAERWRRSAESRGKNLGEYINFMFGEGLK